MKRSLEDAWERARFRSAFVRCLPCQSLEHQPRPVEARRTNFFAQMSGQGLFLPASTMTPAGVQVRREGLWIG